MRKFAAYTLAAAALVGLLLAWRTPSRPREAADAGNPLFFAEGMEDPAARRDWERRRLADPAMGEIPHGIRSLELAFAAGMPSDAAWRVDSLSSPWTQRGPWNLGGRTRAFAMDATNDSILLAGGVSGGIWRSTDAGASWAKVTLPGAHPGVNAIVQDTRAGHTATWYALSGEAYGTSASGGAAFYLGTGLSKSTDGGLTWAVLPSTNSNTPQTFDNVWDATWNVAIDPANMADDVVYAALLGAVMRSSDGGSTWTRVRGSSTSNLSYFTHVMTTPTGVVYAGLSSYDGGGTHNGTHKGIWRSTDGINWANINPPFMPTGWRRIVSACNPLDEDRVYFLVSSTEPAGKMTTDFQGRPEWNSLWRYTYLTGDGSGSNGFWEDLSQNIPATGGPFDKFITQGSYNLVVTVNPADTNMVIIGGTNLYRSTTAFNDSVNTTHIGGYEVGAGTPVLYNGLYPDQHPDHHVLFFHPTQPHVLYNGNDGGIFRSNAVTDSSVTWTSLNRGYMVSQFYTVALDHGTPGSNNVVGGLQDNGSYWVKSANPTIDWKWVAGGDGSYCHVVDGGSTYYFSKQLGVIAKCTVDNAGQVTAFERIDPIGARGYEFINPFVIDPNDEDVMYLPAGRAVWRNSDLGAIALTNGWDSIATNWSRLPDTLVGSMSITAIGISETPANRLYIGTDARNIYRIDDAHTPAPTMTQVASSLMPVAGFVSCLAVDPRDGDHVVAVFSNYAVYSIWESRDAGATWAKAGGNLEQTSTGTGNGPSIRWVEVMPVTGGTYYLAGTSTGIYGTDTLAGLGTTWTQLGAGTIGKAVVNMIDYRESDGMTVIATHGAGIWSATFTGTPSVGVSPAAAGAPSVRVLPNPLVAGSQLEVALPADEALAVTLHDQQGRLVAKVYDGWLRAGQQRLPLPVAGLGAGVYYCRVKAAGWSRSVKCVVVR